MVYCHVRVYDITVAQIESGTRKAIYWSVTVHSKTLSSQCILCFINNYKYNVYLLVK